MPHAQASGLIPLIAIVATIVSGFGLYGFLYADSRTRSFRVLARTRSLQLISASWASPPLLGRLPGTGGGGHLVVGGSGGGPEKAGPVFGRLAAANPPFSLPRDLPPFERASGGRTTALIDHLAWSSGDGASLFVFNFRWPPGSEKTAAEFAVCALASRRLSLAAFSLTPREGLLDIPTPRRRLVPTVYDRDAPDLVAASRLFTPRLEACLAKIAPAVIAGAGDRIYVSRPTWLGWAVDLEALVSDAHDLLSALS